MAKYEKNAPHWIGAKRLEGETRWRWVDGSPWDYEGWGRKGPSGADKAGGNCAWLSKFEGFEHRNCDEVEGFICNKKLCSPPTTGKTIFLR